MNRLLSLAVLLLMSVPVNAQNKTATIKIKSSVYCDHCKECESCGGRLENAMYALKGVKRVDIDDKQNTIIIVYNTQKTSPEKIKQQIAKTGYDADEVKADPEAYAKLDDCCRKQ